MNKIIFIAVFLIVILSLIYKLFFKGSRMAAKMKSGGSLSLTSGFENIIDQETGQEVGAGASSGASAGSGGQVIDNIENGGYDNDILPTAYDSLRMTRLNRTSFNDQKADIKSMVAEILGINSQENYRAQDSLAAIFDNLNAGFSITESTQPYIIEVPKEIASRVDVFQAFNAARNERFSFSTFKMNSIFHVVSPSVVNELLVLLKNNNGFITELTTLPEMVRTSFIDIN